MLALTLETSLIGFGERRYKCDTRKLIIRSKVSASNGGGGVNLIKACGGASGGDEFPWFLPKEVHKIKDPLARNLAQKIQRLPVKVNFSEGCIMSSCVKPIMEKDTNPVVLLHGFDSSCLEWRCTYPLLEEANVETWAIDVLGWGFSDLANLPPCSTVASKRHHLYQLWKSHIKRPMILVGPSLGAAVAIDFAVNFPEAVHKLVLINACVYKDTGMKNLPRILAYAMVYLLKSLPLRLYAKSLIFNGISLSKILDWTTVSRLHCLLPWWEDTTVNYMLSGGYNVTTQIKEVQQKVLILLGDRDNIVHNDLGVRLENELPNATLQRIPGCGHLPHVEKPNYVAEFIAQFAKQH